jgi:uncharacterized protein YecA (UPF0149 family)
MSENNWRESLFYEQKNGYDLVDAEETKLIYAYCEGYKRFMDAARTEREAVKTGIELAEEEGFVPYAPGMALKAGDKVRVSVSSAAMASGARAEAELAFDEKTSVSDSIKANQAGYLPDSIKFARLGRWLGTMPKGALDFPAAPRVLPVNLVL